jgi:hypothetical protein
MTATIPRRSETATVDFTTISSCEPLQAFYAFLNCIDCDKHDKENVSSNVEASKESSNYAKDPPPRRRRLSRRVSSFFGPQNVNLSKRRRPKRSKSVPNLFSRRRQSLKHKTVNNSLVTLSEGHLGCDDEAENMERLETLFPHSTLMERKRFVTGRTLKKSIKKMEHYFEWRQKFNLDDKSFTLPQKQLTNDIECWNLVVAHTAKQMNATLQQPLPRIVRFGNKNEEAKSLKGKRVAHILAALVDLDLASQEFYAACVAAYLDFMLDRNSLESIAVLVDVRPGQGWPNPPAMSLIPFIKTITKMLSKTMPERLDVCLVYPVPSPAKVIWLIVSGFLDAKNLEKIKILWGKSASIDSTLPVEEMEEFFDRKTIDAIENARISEFRFTRSI